MLNVKEQTELDQFVLLSIYDEARTQETNFLCLSFVEFLSNFSKAAIIVEDIKATLQQSPLG